MKGFSSKRVVACLRTILEHCALPTQGGFTQTLAVYGDDAVVQITGPDKRTLLLKPDPSEIKGPSFLIVDDGCRALNELCVELQMERDCRGRVSNKAIQRTAIEAVRTLRTKGAITDEELRSTAQSIRVTLRSLIVPGTAYIPVDNLRLPDDASICIGKVLLRPYSQVAGTIDGLFRDNQWLNPDPEQNKRLQAMILEGLLPRLYNANAACAEITLEVEDDLAPTVAEQEAELAINLLRCYRFALFPLDHAIYVGLRGTVFLTQRPCITVHPNGGFNLQVHSVGAIFAFDLNSERITWLQNRPALQRLSAILGKSDSARSPLEASIVASVPWLGRGMGLDDKPIQVVSLMIGLERLLIGPSERGDKGETLSRRIAFLVPCLGNRRSLYQRFRRLYRLRGEVVHDALRVVADDDMRSLQDAALASLEAIAARVDEWKNHGQLRAWIEERTFEPRSGGDMNDGENA